MLTAAWSTVSSQPQARLWGFACALGLILISAYYYSFLRQTRALLLDFACFAPPKRFKIHVDEIMHLARNAGIWTEDSINFLDRMMHNSGLGPETALCDGVLEVMRNSGHLPAEELYVKGPQVLEETQMVIFQAVDDLLAKTGIKPQEIGVVIAACDCFAPTPSMAAMLVNRYRLQSDVLTYSMAGLGCANAGVCLDLAQHLLKTIPNTLCLIVNHENLSRGGYIGNDRSMLLPLCLFRVSGAAAFLSNRPCDARAAKYDMITLQRTHLGQGDAAHHCIRDHEDDKGIQGVRLSKDIIPSAAKGLRENLTVLGPRVLPVTELVKYVLKKGYEPDFKQAFDHFLLQTGGRGVLDAIEKALHLEPHHMKPSRDSLFRFGNTAGASCWYTLSAIETHTGVQKGDRVLALLFGGGFKAISVVWRARKYVKDAHPGWDDDSVYGRMNPTENGRKSPAENGRTNTSENGF